MAKPRHLVFEGLDRVGKSTLLAATAAAMGVEPVKMRVPKTFEQSREFYTDHFRQLMQSDVPMVWDRGHLSELVYAPIYRPGCVMDWWTKALRSIPMLVDNVTLVYVYAGTTSLMLEDVDRPNKDMAAEVAGFERELGLCEWPVHRICSHEYDGGWKWRPVEERVDELMETVLGEVPLRS